MKKIIDLKDLLKHEILDLYSAEEQIIDALPEMIESANDARLKESLSNHLNVSKTHKDRLDSIKKSLMGDEEETNDGFFSSLFGGSNSVTSRGVEGLIKEAGKLMDEDMTSEAKDAAIIASVQKIAHYEIAGYGTIRAYASELKLDSIAVELGKTLSEVYEADRSLTRLAVGQVNPGAEKAIDNLEEEEAIDNDYDRLTNSVSIMSSSDPETDE
jgi:ferritin-like metal-binding protein YciE